jgi:hypothetical protein
MKKLKIVSGGFCIAFTLYCAVTYITGCTTPQVVTNPDGSSSTNHVVDPRVTTGLAVGSAVNTATAPVNPAFPFVEVGLSAVAAGFGWFAKRKNDKAAANELLLKTVVQAIDALDDQKVKDAIKTHAVNVGTESALNTVVQKIGSGII